MERHCCQSNSLCLLHLWKTNSVFMPKPLEHWHWQPIAILFCLLLNFNLWRQHYSIQVRYIFKARAVVNSSKVAGVPPLQFGIFSQLSRILCSKYFTIKCVVSSYQLCRILDIMSHSQVRSV